MISFYKQPAVTMITERFTHQTLNIKSGACCLKRIYSNLVLKRNEQTFDLHM